MVSHKKKTRKLYIDIAVIIAVVIVLLVIYIIGREVKNSHNTNGLVPAKNFNKQQYSTSSPTSPWVVVNKTRPVNPLNFTPVSLAVPKVKLGVSIVNIPQQLQPAASVALQAMFMAAKKQNISLVLTTAYLPYSYQRAIYNGNLATVGKSAADKTVIRPGYNESQVGLSAQIAGTGNKCVNQICFGATAEGKWLYNNSYKYGYILRYPNGKQSITGFTYEPWLYRYVGISLATQLKATNQTMEQFFNLPNASNYSN